MSTLISIPEVIPEPPVIDTPSIFFKRASFADERENELALIGDIVSQHHDVMASPNKSTTSTVDICCVCHKKKEDYQPLTETLLNKKLQEREQELKLQFNEILEKRANSLKDKFDYILQNEQARASCMLREAHRERKEKVAALQQQLECKNMAGLMYVMCAERTKCKVEKMKIIETYTNYINMLNAILSDGQDLILNLSRGYKTAARLDYEWQEKMKKIIGEFQAYIYHFSGTPPAQNQYLFNLPQLLETEAPKEDDPNENPIEEEQPESIDLEDLDENKEWWQQLDEETRPFVVYGDMADFRPPQRREALKKIKAAKTAPRRWKEYLFHDMFMNSSCPNMEKMKEEYFSRIPAAESWECTAATAAAMLDAKLPSRRQTNQSVDMRGNMGSILKIITTTGVAEPMTKANLLGARDSIEIASTTRFRDKSRSSADLTAVRQVSTTASPPTALNPPTVSALFSHNKDTRGTRRTSFYDASMKLDNFAMTMDESDTVPEPVELMGKPRNVEDDHDDLISVKSVLNKSRTDSLDMIAKHVPDRDHAINYERICPMEVCKRRHVDSFMHSLPAYMRAGPFTAFEKTFDEYETCTPEQLAILKQRLDEKKKKEKQRETVDFMNPLLEWKSSVTGVGVQTSDLSYLDMNLPPCTCRDSVHTSEEETGAIFRVEDLLPMKQNMDKITKECLFDDQIQFDRFKVIGQESDESIQVKHQLNQIKKDFTRDRLREIQKILRQHPSLLDILQANTRC